MHLNLGCGFGVSDFSIPGKWLLGYCCLKMHIDKDPEMTGFFPGTV